MILNFDGLSFVKLSLYSSLFVLMDNSVTFMTYNNLITLRNNENKLKYNFGIATLTISHTKTNCTS